MYLYSICVFSFHILEENKKSLLKSLAMDPLTVLSLVGNVVQFVETAHILISKTVEGYRSLDGSLVENADAELVTRDLIRLKEQLEIQAGVDNVHLGTLCRRCNEVGVELLEGIQKVKGHGGRSGKLKSFRQAVRSVWSRDEIHSIEKRLSNIRDELNLQVCVDLRYDEYFHSSI